MQSERAGQVEPQPVVKDQEHSAAIQQLRAQSTSFNSKVEELKKTLQAHQNEQTALDSALRAEMAALRQESEAAISTLTVDVTNQRSKEVINNDLTEWLSVQLKARTLHTITEDSTLVADWTHLSQVFVYHDFLAAESVSNLVDYFLQKWVYREGYLASEFESFRHQCTLIPQIVEQVNREMEKAKGDLYTNEGAKVRLTKLFKFLEVLCLNQQNLAYIKEDQFALTLLDILVIFNSNQTSQSNPKFYQEETAKELLERLLAVYSVLLRDEENVDSIFANKLYLHALLSCLKVFKRE